MRNTENKVIIMIMMGQLASRLFLKKKELANRLEEVEVRRSLRKENIFPVAFSSNPLTYLRMCHPTILSRYTSLYGIFHKFSPYKTETPESFMTAHCFLLSAEPVNQHSIPCVYEFRNSALLMYVVSYGLSVTGLFHLW